MEEDIMSMDMYSVQDLLLTAITKNAAHTINPFFMYENLDFWGHYVATNNNKCRIIIGGETDHLLFRGQNRDYPFVSSFSRISDPVEKCVQWIKKEEFKLFFQKTPFYKRLPQEIGIVGREFEFDLEALAQHYEFKTDYLDITKNFNVAMFFAYTDCINGRYVPISFENTDYEPHIYISSICRLHGIERDKFKVVGFQVSPRPLNQSAMALNLDGFEDSKNLFTKIALPKTKYFSVGVFNSFKKGYILMPPDILIQHVDQIKNSNILLPELFDKYCETYDVEKNELQQDLIKKEYLLQDKEHELTKAQEADMNLYINNVIHPFIKENIGYRRICRP